MPYRSQGIATAEGSKRIELSYLFKNGFIKKNFKGTGKLKWTDNKGNYTGNIGIETKYTDEEKYLRLFYTITDNNTKEKNKYDYKITIETIKSNLGRGAIPYFVCPQTYDRCRKLYMAYGSHIWKSRNAYRNRIYYSCQSCSKLFYATERYFKLEKIIEQLEKTRMKTTYRGIETKTFQRFKKLQDKKNYFDKVRLYNMSNIFNKIENGK
jgi:hypothetical protein